MPRKAITFNPATASVRYVRINADQSISELSAAELLAAIGGGGGGGGVAQAFRVAYVSTTGSNSNDGSYASPWLTIQKAFTEGYYNVYLKGGGSFTVGALPNIAVGVLRFFCDPGAATTLTGTQLGSGTGTLSIYSDNSITWSGATNPTGLSGATLNFYGGQITGTFALSGADGAVGIDGSGSLAAGNRGGTGGNGNNVGVFFSPWVDATIYLTGGTGGYGGNGGYGTGGDNGGDAGPGGYGGNGGNFTCYYSIWGGVIDVGAGGSYGQGSPGGAEDPGSSGGSSGEADPNGAPGSGGTSTIRAFGTAASAEYLGVTLTAGSNSLGTVWAPGVNTRITINFTATEEVSISIFDSGVSTARRTFGPFTADVAHCFSLITRKGMAGILEDNDVLTIDCPTGGTIDYTLQLDTI